MITSNAEILRQCLSVKMPLIFQSSIQKPCDINDEEILDLQFQMKLGKAARRPFILNWKGEYLNDFTSVVHRIPVTCSFVPVLDSFQNRVNRDKLATATQCEELNEKYRRTLQAALQPETLQGGEAEQ
ncbi:hypothetical protein ONS95_006135 [Cadophora gregata]|uniref:uncharacterized protein n=1 Tax=Cadophora gregata TaxID=51156 RepID=UPI0026DB94B0|nr:uncharacterized protein ONS95_006135 [Cadophora gregata]KAK0102521.1 hypothetical protein ONS95_006135 [Cadophora gregata]KAK0104148.1 hypothetical protein ONS96_005243 [Cadophora gregata f. sp. sojae]